MFAHSAAYVPVDTIHHAISDEFASVTILQLDVIDFCDAARSTTQNVGVALY